MDEQDQTRFEMGSAVAERFWAEVRDIRRALEVAERRRAHRERLVLVRGCGRKRSGTR